MDQQVRSPCNWAELQPRHHSRHHKAPMGRDRSMTAQNAERLLDDFLISLVSPLGFSRVERLIYERQANDIIASLSFPCRVDPRGFAAFTCHVGVRFESLAQWLDDDPK